MTIFGVSSADFHRVQHGLYIRYLSTHRIQSLAVRPLCCTSVIKFLCVLEIMKTILLSLSPSLSLSRAFSLSFPLSPPSLTLSHSVAVVKKKKEERGEMKT